jgi:type 1 glutamine amidotransferase
MKTRPAASHSRLLAGWIIAFVLVTLAWPASAAGSPSTRARILLVTGMDYPGHVWRETAPVLRAQLEKDPRLAVTIIEDPHLLDSVALTNYAAVVLHFQNWETPGPGPAARANLRRFVEDGGGLVLVHFACGAWYGEWPEFKDLAGRAWFGPQPPPGGRQHDPHGAFTVNIRDASHPVTAGLQDFETTDELYTCLEGEAPIRVLATAKSKVDGKDYPMAFVREYGQGRVFHTPLGHDARAFSPEPVGALLRRGTAWAADLVP